MITLKNSKLTVKIDELGAELKSIKLGDAEYMWSGDPAVWHGTAPILFPICGGLKEDKYLLDGKEYSLIKHGFARNCRFDVEQTTEDSAVFLLRSDSQTKSSYPFDFEFRAVFTLCENSVKIDYRVDNLSDDVMYFNVGSHEAFVTPEGIEDYDIVFDEEQTLSASMLYGNLIADTTYPIIKDSKVLPLYDKYFIIDALPFRDIKAKAATLRNRKNGRAVRVDFPDASHLLLWHKHGSGYMCVEPWNGIPDVVGSSYDLTQKAGITRLDSHKHYVFSHTITVTE